MIGRCLWTRKVARIQLRDSAFGKKIQKNEKTTLKNPICFLKLCQSCSAKQNDEAAVVEELWFFIPLV